MELAVLVGAGGRAEAEGEAQLAQRHHDRAVAGRHAEAGRCFQHDGAADGVDDPAAFAADLQPVVGDAQLFGEDPAF